MLNIKGCSKYALVDQVLDDPYFMNEVRDRDYFYALVNEEFIVDQEQAEALVEYINEYYGVVS